MVRGLYTGWTGMLNEQKRLDIVSNNLANASTIGFKKDSVTNQSFEHQLMVKVKDSSENYMNRATGKLSFGVKLGEVYTNHEQGSLRQTENSFDFALEGKGFFSLSVIDSNGNTSNQYTRDGSFVLTRDGYITDANGNRLLGESGEINVPVDAADIAVDSDGTIYADGTLIDRILVRDFDDYNYLRKAEDTRYEAVEGANFRETSATVNQGFTEQSNVNVVSEMVEMISITRAYEANQKIIQTIDGTLELAASSVGRL